MTDTSFTIGFTVDQTPAEVFAAITDVRAWWDGAIDGSTSSLGDSFTYRYEDMHRSTQQITELLPDRRIVWHVTDAELSFVRDKTEWTGTDIIFDITPKGDKTELRFTHRGLVPAVECFDDCSSAWGFYIGACLRSFIATGMAAQPVSSSAA